MDELRSRIPRIPHWRWVLFVGPDHPEWDEPVAALHRYIQEEGIGVALSELESPSRELKRAMKIFLDEPPLRRVIESMLYERCGFALIADALFHKFKEPFSPQIIKYYAKYFYDVEVLNNYDIARYYEKSGHKIPQPPPVPGYLKESYMGFQAGVDVELDVQKALMHIFKSSFFRAQELQQYGWPADDKVIKFQKAAMDAAKALTDGNMEAAVPEAFDIIIEYPESTAIAVDELEGYSPEEDPNE